MRLDNPKIRSISEDEINRIKKATEAAIVDAGGVKLVTKRCRVSLSQLSKYASRSEDNADAWIPLDVAVEVDRCAGAPVILSVYADILGFEVIPKGDADDDVEISEMDAHRIGRKAMDLSSEIFKAREDGNLDALERREIIRKCLRLMRFIVGLMRRLS